jgi:hypothetical protein
VKKISFPKTIFVELTNICNFDCSFCPNHLMERPRGFMEPGLFREIVYQAKESRVERLNLWIMGEPFLHPQAFEFIKFVKEEGLRLSLITNGGLCGAGLTDKLFDLPLTKDDSLLISFLAPCATAFAFRKAGAMNFDDYKEGVFRFIRRRQENNAEFEVVLMYLVNTSSEIVNIPGLITGPSGVLDLLEELRQFSEFRIPKEKDIEKAIKNLKELKIAILPGVYFNLKWLTNWGKSVLPDGLKAVASSRGYCTYPFESLGVFWDGRVTLCCDDYDGKLVVGDVKKNTLPEIFYGQMAEEIRAAMNRGVLLIPRCQVCQGKVVDGSGNVLKDYYKKYYLARLFRHLRSHGLKKTIKKILAEVKT